MIRLAKLTDYGLVLMTCMARKHHHTLHTARGLALESKLPLSTVSKLLKMLLQAGLLISRRGANGGYVLGRQAAALPVAGIIVGLEGPVSVAVLSGGVVGLVGVGADCAVKNKSRAI